MQWYTKTPTTLLIIGFAYAAGYGIQLLGAAAYGVDSAVASAQALN